jgi:hypothetical protein
MIVQHDFAKSKMKNNIITIILIIVVGMVAFWYLNKGSSDNGSTLSTSVQSTDSADAQTVYTLLQQMDQVNLDDSIFSSQSFQSLKENTVTFSPQISGRPNPFSKVGTDSGISGQSIQTTTSTSAVR